jgi:putative DNA primase/helicase
MLGERGGLHHASCEASTVGAWWGKDPTARIGLNLGASELIAFDLEGPAKGADPAGIMAALCEVFGRDALPATWQAVTPSGGRHLLYKAPKGDVPSTLPLEVDGLDRIRHGGSYVVVPAVVAGELVPDADGRQWIAGPSPLEESQPAAAPAWLEDVARETAHARRQAQAAVRARGRRPDTADATPYGAKALMGLWGEVANAPEGHRHTALTRAAVRARALEAGGHVTGDKWREVLADAAARCGLPDAEVLGDPARGGMGILEWAATVATVDPAGPAREGAAA